MLSFGAGFEGGIDELVMATFHLLRDRLVGGEVRPGLCMPHTSMFSVACFGPLQRSDGAIAAQVVTHKPNTLVTVLGPCLEPGADYIA